MWGTIQKGRLDVGGGACLPGCGNVSGSLDGGGMSAGLSDSGSARAEKYAWSGYSRSRHPRAILGAATIGAERIV